MAFRTKVLGVAVVTAGLAATVAHAQTVDQHTNGPKARVERMIPLPPPPPAPTPGPAVSTTTATSPPAAPPKKN